MRTLLLLSSVTLLAACSGKEDAGESSGTTATDGPVDDTDTDDPDTDDTDDPDTSDSGDSGDTGDIPEDPPGYEVWGSDQSNSVAGVESRGVSGSYLWIWDSEDIEAQLAGGADAPAVSCGPSDGGAGPCDMNDVFPLALVEMDGSGSPTGNTLGDLSGYGRLHGVIPDPQSRYVTTNMFAPGGGYVGVMDTVTKEAIGLFRVTATNVAGDDTRSVHMSFWSNDGMAILVANLHGKVLERIDVTRDADGTITGLNFNKTASLGVGKGMAVTSEATYFSGNNDHGNALIGEVTGAYDDDAFGDLTPNGFCKENGCTSGPDGGTGGRGNNVIICPIASDRDNVYVTMGGGGLLVADLNTTPMTLVGEYGAETFNGAGCGGVQVGDDMWLNAGVSAGEAGGEQSTFTMYVLDDAAFSGGNPENTPAPNEIYKDSTNTNTIGNLGGTDDPNTTGQLPDSTTRRDSHGMARTVDGSHVHTVDRIRNVVEVFDASDYSNSTYDLTSEDGQGTGTGPCEAASVSDDAGLPTNDPAPDLLQETPDGKYLMIALRGPTPVSVTHSAQGSCPGVGIVELLDGGASGQLVGVLRSTNSVDTSPVSAPGGHAYTGAERSDIHGAAVVQKQE